MKYEQPRPRSRDELASDLSSDDPHRVATAIIAAALHENDRRYVEDLIVQLLEHPDAWVRGASAIAAGHIARIHRSLDIDRIVPMINRLLKDSRTSGKAQDALDDILMFVDKRQ
jgi:hypothetical protein